MTTSGSWEDRLGEVINELVPANFQAEAYLICLDRGEEAANKAGCLREFVRGLVPEARKRVSRQDRSETFSSSLGRIGPRYGHVERRPWEASERNERMKAVPRVRDEKLRLMGITRRAIELLQEHESEVMCRNLGWLRDVELEGVTTRALAERDGYSETTVRVGIKRVRDKLREISFRLNTQKVAPTNAEMPEVLEPVVGYLRAGELEKMEQLLMQLREEWSRTGHWLNLYGILLERRGEFPEAIEVYEEGLKLVDQAKVRAKILLNLSLVYDKLGRHDLEEELLLRSLNLNSERPQVYLNLLSLYSSRKDPFGCQQILGQLSQYRGDFSASDHDYMRRCLCDEDEYSWLRARKFYKNKARVWFRDSSG